MKIKTLLSLIVAFLAVSFIACDDDLNSVGSSMQPDSDDIFVGVDTVHITAKTVSLNDSVYARTTFGVLGEYTDPIFGKIKSDYMSELYCPDSMHFESDFQKIDSVKFKIEFYHTDFTGDSINPMGITIYEVNKKNLDENYFTNINPTDYCSMSKILAQGAFTIKDLPTNTDSYTSYIYREIRIKASNSLGQRFYDEWKNSNGATFRSSEALREFFKGIYVTSTFGTGSLINVSSTTFDIYYSYKSGLAADGVSDSIRSTYFRLPVTPEVIQLNHIQNDKSVIAQLTASDSIRSYTKSPAGVCTELTIPLKEIMEKTGSGNIVNSATFKLKGFTEEEEKSGLNRPTYLLFVNKDSISDYFVNNKVPNAKTSFLMVKSSTYNNTYTFSSGTALSTSGSDNIAALINFYAKYYKNATTIPDLKYLVIPISLDYNSSYVPTSVYNLMSPSGNIFRTDGANMKMGLIFSKYTERE